MFQLQTHWELLVPTTWPQTSSCSRAARVWDALVWRRQTADAAFPVPECKPEHLKWAPQGSCRWQRCSQTHWRYSLSASRSITDTREDLVQVLRDTQQTCWLETCQTEIKQKHMLAHANMMWMCLVWEQDSPETHLCGCCCFLLCSFCWFSFFITSEALSQFVNIIMDTTQAHLCDISYDCDWCGCRTCHYLIV